MSEPASGPTGSALYQAFWRWHFYAGLVVLPVLMLMALTGGAYLFRSEIDGIVYRRLMTVAPAEAATSPQAWVAAAEGGLGGKAVQATVPGEPGRSAQLVVALPDGARRTAFVDPHDARLLGSIPEGGVMGWVKRLHGLTLFGPVANLLVEVVAGWAIVMVATGVVLWWPRGRSGGVVTVRATPKKRLFWRDLHAVVGVFSGAVIVFLAATGMPWSAFWGQEVRRLTTEAGLGRPAAPSAPAHHEPPPAVPWALQDLQMAGHDHHHAAAPVDLDQVVAAADAAGLPRPYVVTLPKTEGAAWSAAHMPAEVEKTRTLYMDGASGAILADIGYGDFGPAAKAIEWGIAVHQGTQYGRANQFLMLAGCVAVWMLGVSALVMWWKGRATGRLAAPAKPVDRRGYLALAAVVVPLGLLYPLVGASILAVLALDLGLRRLRRPPARLRAGTAG